MRRHRLAALGVALLGATFALGCGDDGPERYPVSVRETFVRHCDATGGDTSTCRCALERLEARLSYADFKREEAAISAGRTPSKAFTGAVGACR
jgi:hypothetical protein